MPKFVINSTPVIKASFVGLGSNPLIINIGNFSTHIEPDKLESFFRH